MADLEPIQPTSIVSTQSTCPTIIENWLAGRKATTRRAYLADLNQFARWVGANDPLEVVNRLLALDGGQANAIAIQWRGDLVDADLSPSTINRRLSTLRSLIDHANRIGLVSWTLNVEGLKSKAYRDTKGPGVGVIREMIGSCDPSTPKDARDRAILRLLFDRGLRRGEVVALDLDDFDPGLFNEIYIVPKGATEPEPVTIGQQTADAINDWIDHRGIEPGPLFSNLDRAGKGQRLTGRSVARIVKARGQAAGVDNVRPHGLRHSAITAALDRNNGDYRAARAFSRHAKLETVAIYDDHRKDVGGSIAKDLAAMI